MLFARLALESDRDALRKLGQAHREEITPHLPWDEERAEATFQRYLTKGNPIVFVVERRREVVGYLWGLSVAYSFTSSFFNLLELIYVRPDMRGSRAAALLMQDFISWTDRLKPDRTVVNTGNVRISAQTVKFIARYGFKQVGSVLQR